MYFKAISTNENYGKTTATHLRTQYVEPITVNLLQTPFIQ